MKLRNRFNGAASAALSVTSLLVGLMSVSSTALAVSSEIYNWQNVRIDGGGFVPGIVFNQKEQDLIYARTDIGGAYRWNSATSSWVPLLDWVGWDNWGWNGVLSLATDPVETNRVYVAAGMYTNSWDPNNGAILRSTDKGVTWKSTALPFKVGGNMPGRGQGERLSIDPNKNNIIYFGAEGGNGLWRSTDYGVTWAKVSSFTNGGTYAADPTDVYGYQSQLQGVTWVTFDPSSGTSGSASQTIYVGVADKANPVYRSTDGGATWAPLLGTPVNYLAHKGVYDAVNSVLYISTSDTGGPYDGAKGEVWKLDTKTGTWTNISPIQTSSSDLYFGYSGLTIDRKNPKTIMVASQVAWWPDAIFFRSIDGGATWTRIWDWNGYPSRSFRYTQDITENPWLNFGVTSPVAPETSPKLGWMNESLEIDPFNSNRLMYGTGATLYATDNLTNWDAGTQILIKPRAKGIEETAVLDLVSPPTGAPLYSALGDISGFRHDDLTKVPSYNFSSAIHTSTTSIDYAELSPSTMVRVGNASGSTGGIGISTSAGNSWWAGQAPSGVTGGGNVALSADGGAIVWSPGGIGVQMSTTFGSTWVASTGVPSGATVESDRVNPAKFYATSGSSFYISTNKGATFTATAGTGLPEETRKFKAVYGREGDIWLASDTDTAGGLYHSTDSGTTFTKIAGVDRADNVSFGKAAPSQTYPAIYIVGKVDGVRGVFRSNDAAATWVRINDDLHQYGNFGEALSGDPRVYGRVYVGTNGRGVIWGDSTTVTSTSSSSVTSTSSSSKTSSSSSSVVATSTSSAATSTSSAVTSTSSSVKTSSSVATSTSSSTSSSTCAASQCNWYGTLYPSCVTTTSGWGYENGKSCIATSTCNSQPSPYGVVTNACGTSSSSAITSTSSSVKTSSSSSSSSVVATSTSSSKTSSSTSSATSSRTSSATSTSTSSSSSSVAASKCQYVVTNQWNTGFTAAVRITNSGTTAINGWNVSWTYTDGTSLSSGWGGTLSGTNPYSATNLDWNKTIQPGQTVEVGVQGTKGSSTSAQVPAVTGAACN